MHNKWCPPGWAVARLQELGEVNRGRSRHRPRYAKHLYGGPYPFIQTGDVKNSEGRITCFTQTYSEAGLAQSRLWPIGTMCITIAANIAETGILTFPACFPDSIVGFIADKSRCDIRFIEYLFRHLRAGIQNNATGSAQDNINLDVLRRLQFPLPPLAEQHAIADLLASIDDKLQLNRRVNETLEAITRAIFKSWFIDFDPVRAKMAGRFLILSKSVADKFPESFRTCSLGEVPFGWQVKTLDEVLSHSRVAIGDGKAPAYSANVGGLAPREERFSKQLSRSEQKNKKIKKNDLVFGLSRNVLNFGLMKGEIGSVSPVYEVFKVNDNIYRPELLERYIRQKMDWFMDILKPAAREGQAIDRQYLLKKHLIIPPRSVQDEFARIAELMAVKIRENQYEMKTLAALRDTLLPKLMLGEIRLKQREKLVKAHA